MTSLLSGWGRYPRIACRTRTPRSEQDVQQMVADEPEMIAHGMGRSYGDAALNANCTLRMDKLDRMLAFDEEHGILTCESGVRLADVIDAFLPRGWFPPVTPGTKYVTIGGMFASDVHGKNHHLAGSFGAHVEAIDLLLADGQTITCTHTQNAELFAATRGGMGLTGIILRLTFRLHPVQSGYIRQQTLRARNLAQVMAQFESSAAWTYSVAWIDCLAQGPSLGRAVLYRGEHATAEEYAAAAAHNKKMLHHMQPTLRNKKTVPPIFPSWAVNKHSVRAFNRLYYRRAKEGVAIVDYDRFFYPLDALLEWNRLYGRRGFVQYQCVLPKAASAQGLQQILGLIADRGRGSFLATLKLFGPEAGMLSFPMEGYSLALDFPANAPSLALLETLDAIVADHGGRIYLAKDARAKAANMQRFYPALADFLRVRFDVQGDTKFSSLLSQRLAI